VTLLEDALRYAALDLHVIPVHVLIEGECSCPKDSDTRKDHPLAPLCKSPGKHPAIKGWQKSASIDRKVLEGWFSREPRNIGLVCAQSGIVVVDVDPRNGGRETLAALIDKLGPLPETVTAHTGGDGEHYLFRSIPAELDSKLGKGIDLQRGPRQIVVEPSVHPSGKPYRWLHAPGVVPIADLPAAWIDYATRKPAPRHVTAYRSHDHERQAKRAAAWIEKAAPSIQGSNGSGKLYTAACRAMHGFTLDDSTTKTILCNHFNPRCDPQWSEREIDHVIDSARKHHAPSQWLVEDKPKDDLSRARAKKQTPDPVSAPPTATVSGTSHGHAGLGPEGGYRCTDLGNARRFADMHSSRMRYVHAWGCWVTWDGRRWRRDEGGADTEAAKQVNAAIYADAGAVMQSAAAAINAGGSVGPTFAEALMKWASKTAASGRISAMVSLARSEPEISAQQSEFNRDPWLLNVANGTIDLRDGELQPHRQADMITLLSDVEYDSKAEAPEWERFLCEVIPDAEVRGWIQRYLGYSLSGLVSEQQFAFWVGKGGNGKNVCIDAVVAVMGEYAMVGAPELLLEKRNDTHPTELADIEGRRLVVCSEIEQGRAWAEARIKEITGNKTIKARKMKQDFFEFEATSKLVVLANTKPKVKSADNGLWRRMNLVPWPVQIPPERRDRYLLTRLIANERPGILAWLVRGCLAWQNQGLGTARSIQIATDDYRKQEDVLGLWVTERCREGEDMWASTTSLYEDYKSWCKDEGIDKPWTLKTWKARLIEREGIADRPRMTGRGLSGIRLLESYEKELQ
jgi:putative DNA primase/helicase